MNNNEIESFLEPVDENYRKSSNAPNFDPKQDYVPPVDTEIKEIQSEDSALTVTVTPAVSEKTATGVVAKRLAEMLYNGATREQALKTLGIEEHELDTRELAVQANSILLSQYSFPDEARRLMVKASLNKLLTEAVMNNDIDTVLKAAKQIASDPDVGLTAAPQQVVNISLEKAKDALNIAVERKEFDFDE
jgi:hypothetical protein